MCPRGAVVVSADCYATWVRIPPEAEIFLRAYTNLQCAKTRASTSYGNAHYV